MFPGLRNYFLGIDSFRTSTASKFLETIDIEDLLTAIELGNKERLIHILRNAEGIDKTAESIAEALIDKLDELKELLSLMTIKKPNKVNTDKTILVSGFRPDDEFIDKVNNLGFDIKSSGSKYDLLIVKDESYLDKSKARNAMKNNKEIVTLKEFKNKYMG